jgi:hypothetical protein
MSHDCLSTRKKGLIFTIRTCEGIIGEQVKTLILDSIQVGAPDVVWVIGGKSIYIRVKSAEQRILNRHKKIDQLLERQGIYVKLIYNPKQWIEYMDYVISQQKDAE